MSLTLDTAHDGTKILDGLKARFSLWRNRRRAEKRRADTRREIEKQPDWLLDDIGAERSAKRNEKSARPGFW